MSDLTPESLARGKCHACEGLDAALPAREVDRLLPGVPDWALDSGGACIRRTWTARDFPAAIDFFNRVANLAETEGHHPDLHLEGYRNVAVVVSTHAVGGLTENDFVLAAKIDRLPIALRATRRRVSEV